MLRQYRQLTALADGATLRTAQLHGDDYIIVSIVALKSMVLRPMNSKVGEYVPVDVIRNMVSSFANRPIVMDHPVNSSGEAITANEPTVLESQQFGICFHPKYDDGLVIDAWFNKSRAESVGGEASQVIEDLEAKKVRPVSVGVSVLLAGVGGVAPDGVEYGDRWEDGRGDHLAMLNSNNTGACSVEDGCGPVFEATRAATYQLRAAGGNVRNTQRVTNSSDNKARFLETGCHYDYNTKALLLNGELNDVETNRKLWLALAAVEGSGFDFFGWVLHHYAKQRIVIYTMLGEDDTEQIWQRRYTIDSDLDISFKGERVEVMGFEPVLKNATNDGGELMKASKEVLALVDTVIKCEKCPFEDSDRAALELMSEDKLTALAESFSKPVEPVAPVAPAAATPTPAVAAASEPLVTREEFDKLIVAVGDLKPAADNFHQTQADHRAQLISEIQTAKPGLQDEFISDLSTSSIEVLHAELVPKPVANYGLTSNNGPIAKAVPKALSVLDKIKERRGHKVDVAVN